MATAFSENEKEMIKNKLKEAAQECLGRYGVKKTTVDQLVQMAGISKGGFYIFYPSKEELFFTVLEEYQGTIMKEAENKLDTKERIGSKEFTEIIFDVYQKVKGSFMIPMIQNQEYDVLIRKLPLERIASHHSFDDQLGQSLFSHLRVHENVDLEVITAALRAIFVSMLHIKEIGEKNFDEVLRLLILGLAQQFIKED